MSNPPSPTMRNDAGEEYYPWVNVSLWFFKWHEYQARNGTFVRTKSNNETLTSIEKWLTYGWPETDRVQKAYDEFMQLCEANKNPIPQKGQLEHNYAERSANLRAASKALKETLRQYGNK